MVHGTVGVLFHEALNLLGFFEALTSTLLCPDVLEQCFVFEHKVCIELVAVGKLLPLLLVKLKLQLRERIKSILTITRYMMRFTTKTFQLLVSRKT